jgi:hypothetical protein
MMSPTMMRQFWAIVETTQSHLLLNLDDSSLIGRLLGELSIGQPLRSDERDACQDYIRDRLPLIRDLAQSRRLGSSPSFSG